LKTETEKLISAIINLTQVMRESSNRTIEGNRCYTTKEAAAALRVSPRTIVRAVEANALRYRQILEHGYIFMGEDLLDYLDAMQKVSETKKTKLRRVS
jgi:excisionase family DNA binding protein